MSEINAIETALAQIVDPLSGKNIVASGIVRALTFENNKVSFVLDVAAEHAARYSPIRDAAHAAVQGILPSAIVSAVVTAHSAPKAPPDLKPAQKKAQDPQALPGVANVIAVASGKGGVGKSTLTANLAAALAAQGRRVGLLDADVYGPSQPRMMGVSGRPESPDGKIIIPKNAYDVTVMSIGLMLDERQAVIWRGPMLMGALQQMLGQVQWGALDVLLVDLPPGTGDVQLTLSQKTALSGAIVISTPQDVALLDARKGIDMFNKLKVPILGLVENMSYYICPKCGNEAHIFGTGGVAAEAKEIGVPLLAQIPLDLDLRLAGDEGVPIVVKQPDGPLAKAFHNLAASLVATGVA